MTIAINNTAAKRTKQAKKQANDIGGRVRMLNRESNLQSANRNLAGRACSIEDSSEHENGRRDQLGLPRVVVGVACCSRQADDRPANTFERDAAAASLSEERVQV